MDTLHQGMMVSEGTPSRNSTAPRQRCGLQTYMRNAVKRCVEEARLRRALFSTSLEPEQPLTSVDGKGDDRSLRAMRAIRCAVNLDGPPVGQNVPLRDKLLAVALVQGKRLQQVTAQSATLSTVNTDVPDIASDAHASATAASAATDVHRPAKKPRFFQPSSTFWTESDGRAVMRAAASVAASTPTGPVRSTDLVGSALHPMKEPSAFSTAVGEDLGATAMDGMTLPVDSLTVQDVHNALKVRLG